MARICDAVRIGLRASVWRRPFDRTVGPELDAQQGLDGIAAPGWPRFERRIKEAFRRQEHAGQGSSLVGAAGGRVDSTFAARTF